MTATHRRAARLEERTATVLQTTRVRRTRFESAPDVRPVTLASGLVLQPEAKTRARLPLVIGQALEQARRYLPDAIALAVIRQRGGRAIACLDLDDFARIAGIAPADLPAQLPLLLARKAGAK
jgi:predicted nucleic acid-binding protein